MSERSKYQIRAVFDEALSLFERKNADYGDAWRLQGWRGNLSRIMEKVQRLRTTLWRNGAISFEIGDEDGRQTALDMMNSLAFFILNWDERREWGHEEVFPDPATDPRRPITPGESVIMPSMMPPAGLINPDLANIFAPMTPQGGFVLPNGDRYNYPTAPQGSVPLPAADQMRDDASTAAAWPAGQAPSPAPRGEVEQPVQRKPGGKRPIRDNPQA